MPPPPDNYADYQRWWAKHGPARLAEFAAGRSSYVRDLCPQRALELPTPEVLQLLHHRLGADTLSAALAPGRRLPGPVSAETNGEWLRRCHTVGVNVRTVGHFWNVVKYALTLPAHLRGVHLLPVWEPGVVASLYGLASWRINPEFFSPELAARLPGAGTVEDQLRITVNLLHALGKAVGMDVIPHTDRYSEMVLAHPHHFEWLRRDGLTIVDHSAKLHRAARHVIREHLAATGGTVRSERLALIDRLYRAGLEPLPATMGPPYRGLAVDPDPAARTVDAAGREWRDYRITHPTAMSRAFGPLTRYKFWGRRDDNRGWAIDFGRPRRRVWRYFTGQYAAVQAAYGFDFMRGDMSHVQMRPGGVPDEIDDYYDPLRAVKRRIRRRAPHFAYFAEGFLAPDDTMAYGNEADHLRASEAEVTLGNLQSMAPGTDEFMDTLGGYLDLARDDNGRRLTPAFTAITGDKDDPRFDAFHHHGEVARLFFGLFNPHLPLYYSLGFRQRDRHYEPWANAFYTKLYVFREESGPKATHGPWRWGGNFALFRATAELDRFAEGLEPHLRGGAAGAVRVVDRTVVYWTRADTYGPEAYLFVVNFAATPRPECRLPQLGGHRHAELLYAHPPAVHHQLVVRGGVLSPGELGGGAVRCYRLSP